MALMDYILGPQNVQQLPVDQQQAARSEGYRRLILGSLLGGRGLASGFEATQQVIPEMRAAQQRQRLVQAQESAMVPTGVRAGSQLDMLNRQLGLENDPGRLPDVDNRTAAALQRVAGGTGMQGTGLTAGQQLTRRFDPRLYSQNVIGAMDPTKPKDILEAAKAGAGQVQGGLVVNPFDPTQILGSLPEQKDGVQTRFVPEIDGFVAQPVLNFEQSRPVQVGAGQRVTPTGAVQFAPGFVSGQAELTGATTEATRLAQSLFEDVTYIDEQGNTRTESRFQMLQRQGLIPPTAGAPAAQPGQSAQPGQAQPTGARVTQLGPLEQSRMKQYDRDLERADQQASAARQREGTYARLRQVFSDPNFDPTSLTPVRAQLTGLLRGIGVTGADADNFLRQFRTAEQAVNRLTLDTLPELVGAISNFEIGYVGSTQPRITDSRRSALFNISVLEAAGERAKERQKFLLENKSPDAILQWEQSPQGRRELFDDPKLLPFIKEFSAPEDRRTVTEGPNKGKTAYRMPSGRFRIID